MTGTNYRLDITVELDTSSKPRAERWKVEIENAIDAVGVATDILVDLSLVDEYGETVAEDAS